MGLSIIKLAHSSIQIEESLLNSLIALFLKFQFLVHQVELFFNDSQNLERHCSGRVLFFGDQFYDLKK